MSEEKAALQYLVEEVSQGRVIKVPAADPGDQVYVTKFVHLPPAEPVAAAITVATLTSLCGYLAANRDTLDLDHQVVHVEEHDRVRVLGPLHGRHRRREVAIEAVAPVPSFAYGVYHEAESFNVALQSIFLPTAARETLLAITARLRSSSEVVQDDDGITQKVTVTRGVELFELAKTANPVTLQPWRTFPEVEQPESDFVLRLRQGQKGVDAALFEADGGRWQIEARRLVAEFLTNNLRSTGAGEVVVIW